MSKADEFLRNHFIRRINTSSRPSGNPASLVSSGHQVRLTKDTSANTDRKVEPESLDVPAPKAIGQHPDPFQPAIKARRPRNWFKRLVFMALRPKDQPIPPEIPVPPAAPVNLAKPPLPIPPADEDCECPPDGAPIAELEPEVDDRPAMPILRKLTSILVGRRRVPTAEEVALQREAERRKLLERQLVEEARLFRVRIINVLNRRGLCYRYKKSERDFMVRGVQSVDFSAVKIYPEALYFFIDTARLPRDIGVLQLVNDDVLTDLSIACGHRVSGHFSEKCGCIYIIERATGIMGIPNHVKLDDMLEQFPASADGLSIPFGMTTNARPVYKSLGSMYSMLIGGTIGAGKSNFANVMLCTLLRRNPPDRLKMILIDLKGGLEFNFYEGVPHLLTIPEFAPNGICYERTQVPGVLEWVMQEGERRIAIIKAAGFKDIGRYNHGNRKGHLPHIILMVDEWADIRLDRKTGAESEELITNIASRFRAVGIHVIICTQTPKVEVISTRIKSVLPAKVAFSCPTNTASMLILDNTSAKSLEPAGRCVLQHSDEIQIQTPFISDAMIREIVEGAKAGKFEPSSHRAHDVTELEILEWALEMDAGWLNIRKLFENFKSRGITQAEIKTVCQSFTGKEYVIGSSLYRVEPPAGQRGRRLVAVESAPEAEAK